MIEKLKNKAKSYILNRWVYNSKKRDELPQILQYLPATQKNDIFHVSAFNYGNAGDVLLPIALHDLWNKDLKTIKWIDQNVYPTVTQEIVDKINHTKGLIIGGGGLFLKDTNANKISGWQWPCSIEMLDRIEVPLVFYAVGYNRFRGQEEFDDFFKDNLQAFAEKSVYMGLRNTGSIEALKNYLPANLHHKLRFQPCMTTFLSEIYPDITNYHEKRDFVAVNAAFDRSHLRFGENIGNILNATAKAVKRISKDMPIKFYSHMPSDDAFLPFLQSYGVKYEVVKLNNVHPTKIIEEYAKPKLVVGMRGHAQMIPFGCKTPIVSIVSHNKMQWFLDDIGQPNWGADVLSESYQNDLEKRMIISLENTENEMDYISKKQKQLFEISQSNVNEGLQKMNIKK
ncbi:polysaccharide pyruvyl transferase family protein [Chryseobacterium sp. SC28]|uniref:polysaccharide pyruvyl transferase family protein n=1 Tax=Chryseobacterium sp. SC28 TaxID=2268028 RepID=UPI000F64EB70|nr:polysaccharide pyruvyl transferase family protein [Chryseobacterium sp. SC28]RRQ45837.1 polysaccharide pyruvyl transferase family protein [Chryseobacterium sp. SC28]